MAKRTPHPAPTTSSAEVDARSRAAIAAAARKPPDNKPGRELPTVSDLAGADRPKRGQRRKGQP